MDDATITHWKIIVVAPDGTRDRGTLTNVMLDEPPTPKQIADALADIAWRIAHDLAQERVAKES
jgi:hypothetical protein